MLLFFTPLIHTCSYITTGAILFAFIALYTASLAASSSTVKYAPGVSPLCFGPFGLLLWRGGGGVPCGGKQINIFPSRLIDFQATPLVHTSYSHLNRRDSILVLRALRRLPRRLYTYCIISVCAVGHVGCCVGGEKGGTLWG